MTIKTLIQIRRLLVQEAETRRADYEQARQAHIDDGKSSWDDSPEVGAAWRLYDAAIAALQEFDNKEWQ